MNHKHDDDNHNKFNIHDIKDSISESLKTKADEVKQKAAEIQDSVTTYVKKNPFKSVGFGVLFGAIIGKLFNRK